MFNTEKTRKESEVFKDLELLCQSNGYLHAIAYFCFRDNVVKCNDKVKKEDFLQQYGTERLLRSEISTLIGLACKKNFNLEIPEPKKMQEYIDETENLLKELHHSMIPNVSEMFKFDENNKLDKSYNPFKEGKFLREPIFYGGESAYHFQYRDLSKLKYKQDESWIINNKGYSLDELFSVIETIGLLQLKKVNDILPQILKTHPTEWTVLDAFSFTVEEVKSALSRDLSISIINKVINSFVSVERYDFEELNDFNPKNAFPILKIDDNHFLLFQNYSLLEALYESPFFWFWDDKSYRSTAMTNRGNFTENFSTERLKLVFGQHNVHQNINIIDKKGNIAGEIDVLVIFANRAIVLQAKSKKLTIASRRGNDKSLRSDFKKAVQDAYDQAYSCAELILKKQHRLVKTNNDEIDISKIDFQEIYPVCVVSDHYPALFFQAKHFLSYKETEKINAPFIMDVFFLDVFSEMLNTPLYFLSYLNQRTNYSDKILATHEMTILAYHLKNNLWFNDEMDQVFIADDYCSELDMAMLTRRDGLNSITQPEGILTKYKNTNIGNFISQIEKRKNANTIDFGFLLLKISEDTVKNINTAIDTISSRTLKDKKTHDITIAFDTGDEGHCCITP